METYALADPQPMDPEQLEVVRKRTEEHHGVKLATEHRHWVDERGYHCYEWEQE
jgi:hypothetical protein